MTAIRFVHLADRLFGQPLMLHPGKLRTIVAVVAPRMGMPTPSADWGGPDEMPTEASDAPAAPVGIAVIPIHGSLVQRNAPNAMSGMRSYEDIAAEFSGAMADGNVSGIVLHIDSGGGEVSGAFDLADTIFSARGQKPILAVASERAYSAAYLLASAADTIVVPRTGGVGSIGVVCVHCDMSGMDQQMGMIYTPVFAGAKKIDGWPHSALSDRAHAEVQAEVDRCYGLFCDTVARNLNVPVAKIRATEAGCLYGADAVTAGLAHDVGLFGDAVRMILPPARPALPAMPPRPMPAMPGMRSLTKPSTKELAPMVKKAEAGADPVEEIIVDPPADPVVVIDPPADPPAVAQSAERPVGVGGAAQVAATVDEATIRAAAYGEGHSAGSIAGYQAAMARVSETMDLCAIAKRPDLVAGFIGADTPVAQVRRSLLAARADVVDRDPIDSHAPVGGGAKALDQLNSAADALQKTTPKLTKAQAFTAACNANPSLYQAYRAETRN